MATLALNICMQGKRVAVIGGGAVALRKLRTLLTSGASVKVTAPEICPEIQALYAAGTIEVEWAAYSAGALENVFLAVAATDNPAVNEQIRSDAGERGLLVAVTDNPLPGDCMFPALLRRGDLEIAVSTGGLCPTFAADVRDEIARHIGSEYGQVLEQLAAEREKLLTNGKPRTYNTQILRSLSRRLLAIYADCKEPTQ